MKKQATTEAKPNQKPEVKRVEFTVPFNSSGDVIHVTQDGVMDEDGDCDWLIAAPLRDFRFYGTEEQAKARAFEERSTLIEDLPRLDVKLSSAQERVLKGMIKVHERVRGWVEDGADGDYVDLFRSGGWFSLNENKNTLRALLRKGLVELRDYDSLVRILAIPSAFENCDECKDEGSLPHCEGCGSISENPSPSKEEPSPQPEPKPETLPQPKPAQETPPLKVGARVCLIVLGGVRRDVVGTVVEGMRVGFDWRVVWDDGVKRGKYDGWLHFSVLEVQGDPEPKEEKAEPTPEAEPQPEPQEEAKPEVQKDPAFTRRFMEVGKVVSFFGVNHKPAGNLADHDPGFAKCILEEVTSDIPCCPIKSGSLLKFGRKHGDDWEFYQVDGGEWMQLGRSFEHLGLELVESAVIHHLAQDEAFLNAFGEDRERRLEKVEEALETMTFGEPEFVKTKGGERDFHLRNATSFWSVRSRFHIPGFRLTRGGFTNVFLRTWRERGSKFWEGAVLALNTRRSTKLQFTSKKLREICLFALKELLAFDDGFLKSFDERKRLESSVEGSPYTHATTEALSRLLLEKVDPSILWGDAQYCWETRKRVWTFDRVLKECSRLFLRTDGSKADLLGRLREALEWELSRRQSLQLESGEEGPQLAQEEPSAPSESSEPTQEPNVPNSSTSDKPPADDEGYVLVFGMRVIKSFGKYGINTRGEGEPEAMTREEALSSMKTLDENFSHLGVIAIPANRKSRFLIEMREENQSQSKAKALVGIQGRSIASYEELVDTIKEGRTLINHLTIMYHNAIELPPEIQKQRLRYQSATVSQLVVEAVEQDDAFLTEETKEIFDRMMSLEGEDRLYLFETAHKEESLLTLYKLNRRSAVKQKIFNHPNAQNLGKGKSNEQG